MRSAIMAAGLAFAGCGAALAQGLELSDAGTGPNSAAQVVVDAIRAAARADIAIQAAGFFKDGKVGASPDPNALNKLLAYPGEEVYVLELTGAQIRKALERSLSLLPQSNRGFLQVSGLRVRFSPQASPQSRLKSVMVGDKPLQSGAKYRVAAPATLARGALGYFTVWQKEQIVGMTGVTVEQAVERWLSGKRAWPLGEANRIVAE
jgi:2',3'-cyclic-nucleotide 2'-phosphodiesterase (5'-nucleotidase family)